jgi:transcriptional regulator GlxA family with amidase domain
MTQNQLMKSSRGNQPDSASAVELDGDSRRTGGLFCNDENEGSDKVERSVTYMIEHLDRPLNVATLAAMANVSPSHFFALFKQRMGCSPMDYFTRIRMRHACQLLDSTSARVKEVAAALGYDDPFYFSRVFKSLSAVAPMHYRSLGLELRLEIKELLEPKSQMPPADPLRRIALSAQ